MGTERHQEHDVAAVPSPSTKENVTAAKPGEASGLSTLEKAAQDTNTAAESAATTTPAYSAFSKKEKRFIMLMVTMASFFSPLSGQIYYPIMPALAQNYHLSNALVNLTISTYMIFQGLAPSFMGTFADSGGRRPAYILAFAVYTVANIGLALQNNFAALLALRCVQSAGSSGTVTFGYGVVADIATPAERGTYIGPMAAGVMIAPAVGPVVGGLLGTSLGWRSVFWLLVIISGGYLILFVVVMPETARKIVGDGTVPPKGWWRMSVVQYIKTRRRLRELSPEERKAREGQRTKLRTALRGKKFSFPNPLRAFAILLERDALIIISYVGVVMFCNIAMLTTIPNLFGGLYGYNNFQIGLCFMYSSLISVPIPTANPKSPLGVSSCVAAVVNGKLVDWNYARAARLLGFPVDNRKTTDPRRFPIEKTRLQTVFPGMVLGIAAFLPYGWVLQQRAPLAAPLVLQFIVSFCFIASLNTLNTLLIDLFPDRPATAAAACNLVRCWLGAGGAAAVDHMLGAMGWGWCFGFLGLVMASGLVLLWVEGVYGMGWREKRLERVRARGRD